MFRSFRLQLTAWYLAFLTLLLAGFSGFLYILLQRNLYARVDATLESTAETAATLFRDEMDETHGDAPVAAAEIVGQLLHSADVAIWQGSRQLAASAAIQNVRLPGETGTYTLANFGRHGARVEVRRVTWKEATFQIVAVEPLDAAAGQLEALRHIFYIALPAAILIAGLGGFLLAAKSIAPVVSMAEQAEAITDKNLHTRLEAAGARVEFARLAAVFNELLERLDRSFARMRDFMADASHELRTPLAIIRGEADVALERNRQPAEYRESLAIIQDEARRLTKLVEDLLHLARADAGHPQIRAEEIYLNDLLEECCRRAQAQARQKGVRLEATAGSDLAFRGDPDLLRRLISNLLDNSIRYTPAGGLVEAKLLQQAAGATLTVHDTGIGIPAEAQEKIFERFYRVDKSRSRAEGGFGLGLSIVKWIAEAHQGSVTVESRPDAGTTFTVVLPMAQPAPSAVAPQYSSSPKSLSKSSATP